MNAYRLTADGLHVLAIVVLFVKFFLTRNANGISGRTQILYLVTYTARYLDLYTNFVSIYNTSMKVMFIVTGVVIVCLIFHTFRRTYDKKNDTFRIELLLIACAVLAFFVNHEPSFLEIMWTFSIYSEAVALIPQFHMAWKAGKTEGIVFLYVILMVLYRGYYLFNWIYRYYDEGYYDLIAVIGGVTETLVGLIGISCMVRVSFMNLEESKQLTEETKKSWLPSILSQDLKERFDTGSLSTTKPFQDLKQVENKAEKM